MVMLLRPSVGTTLRKFRDPVLSSAVEYFTCASLFRPYKLDVFEGRKRGKCWNEAIPPTNTLELFLRVILQKDFLR